MISIRAPLKSQMQKATMRLGRWLGDATYISNGKDRLVALAIIIAFQLRLTQQMRDMAATSDRLYFAGRHANWQLARYFHRQLVKQLDYCAATRPQYAEELDSLKSEACESLAAAITSRSDDEFLRAWAQFVAETNGHHGSVNKGYIRYLTPTAPPSGIDFGAPTTIAGS